MNDRTTADELPALGAREIGALQKIAEHQAGRGLRIAGPYYSQPMSMQKLAKHGYVEPIPGYEHYNPPGMRITGAGLNRVKELTYGWSGTSFSDPVIALLREAAQQLEKASWLVENEDASAEFAKTRDKIIKTLRNE